MIGYMLFGGRINNLLTSYLNKRELKKLEEIITIGEAVEESVFIDECIQKRISSNKLINWKDLPFFVPKSIIRVLKKATNKPKSRYSNISEFIAGLQSAKSNLPYWQKNSEGIKLSNWYGNDYLITSLKDKSIVKKGKSGNESFRKDNRFLGTSHRDVYASLKEKLNLP